MEPDVSGISVYFNNNTKMKNIVFFDGKRHKAYDDGGMLFEIIGDEAFYILTEKVKRSINSFPDRYLLPTKETIANGFMWICGLIEDEDYPILSALLKSSFCSAIDEVLNDPDLVESWDNTGAFLMVCYEEYEKSVAEFEMLFASLALCESGTNDQLAIALAEDFKSEAAERMAEYSIPCHYRHVRNHLVTVETVQIINFYELLMFEYCRMQKNNKVIKICANCGRYFMPLTRNDRIYCDETAPQNSYRTCKQIGSYMRRMEKIHTDPYERQYHNIRCKWNMAIHREKTERNADEAILENFRKRKLKELSQMDPVISENLFEGDEVIDVQE